MWGKIWLFCFCVWVGLCVGTQKQMCQMCVGKKLFLKNVRWGKNKKHWVGNECRLTRCSLEIWSLCWSPVKMVYPFANVQFLVICLWLQCRLLGLLLTFWRLAKVAIFTTNVAAENQTLINHKCVCGVLNRHFCQTPVMCSIIHSSILSVVLFYYYKLLSFQIVVPSNYS